MKENFRIDWLMELLKLTSNKGNIPLYFIM